MVDAGKANPIHRLTIAAIAASLRNMAQIMDKAESHVSKDNIGLDAYLQARLYPDMYNLLQQVQYVCYVSVDLARHFSDAPAPHVGYDETTWPELRKSVDTAAEGTASRANVRVDPRRRMTASIGSGTTTLASSGVRGATTSCSDVRSRAGAGSALRSTFPFGVSGSSDRLTTALGTMYAGSRSAR